MGILKKFIAIATLVASTLLMTSSVGAQSCVVVKRGGQNIIVTKYNSRYGTPNRHRVRQHRYRYNKRYHYDNRRSRYIVRPRFIYQRHINKHYYRHGHTRSRCYFCKSYDKWRSYPRNRRHGYDPVIHVYRRK